MFPCPHGSEGECEEHTETELDDEELEGVGNLKDEDLDLDGQAVLVAGAATARRRVGRVAAAGNDLSPELALGKSGGSSLEGLGDGIKVGLQLLGGIVLLGEAGVVGVGSGSGVCCSKWLISRFYRVGPIMKGWMDARHTHVRGVLANEGGQLIDLSGLALQLALRNDRSRESRGGESEEREEDSGLHFGG